jgi:hypothetical protein
MFKHLSLSCFLLALVVPSAIFAAPKGEKVGSIRAVTNPAFKSSGSCAEDAKWNEVKMGTFRQLDCFKTGDGGSVGLELKENNSTFSIGENSLVSINNLVEKDESGAFRIKLDIQKGYMGFKVQKGKGNTVDFSTGTAAASIRGTEGVIGGNDNAVFAGLKNGELAVNLKSGDSVIVQEGQTAVGKDKFVVLSLASSGDLKFAKILSNILADTTLSLDSLVIQIQKADSAYAQNAAALSKDAPVQDTQKAEAPQIKYVSYDSLRCAATLAVSGLPKGGKAHLAALMDGSKYASVDAKRDMRWNATLSSGVHEYEFFAENEGGSNSVKKTLGCYPKKPFSVKVFGDQTVRMPIPPAPPNVADVITQTVQFQIRVPENDPFVLNKVTVKQNGKVILQERLSQIQNLDYQIPVELKRGFKNRVDIEVVHKSGYVVKTSKVYEVGK